MPKYDEYLTDEGGEEVLLTEDGEKIATEQATEVVVPYFVQSLMFGTPM
jgi:hypothetical protein